MMHVANHSCFSQAFPVFSLVHTGDSRRFRRLKPKTATIVSGYEALDAFLYILWKDLSHSMSHPQYSAPSVQAASEYVRVRSLVS